MRGSLALLVAACLGTWPAHAGPAVDARYSVQTMGVDLGRAELRLDRANGGVKTRFRFETDALLGFVEASDTRMESETASARGKVNPRSFEGIYQKEDRTREVDMAYGAEGAIDSFQLIKRGTVRVDAVPKGLAAGIDRPAGRVPARTGLAGSGRRRAPSWSCRCSTAASATTRACAISA